MSRTSDHLRAELIPQHQAAEPHKDASYRLLPRLKWLALLAFVSAVGYFLIGTALKLAGQT